MKRLVYLIAILNLIACKKASDRECWKFSGGLSTISYNINKNNILLYDDINLVLINDSTNYIEIIGNENIIKHIILDTSNNNLIMSNINSCKFLRKPNEVFVHYHYTKLEEINLFGYGQLLNSDTINHNIKINTNKAFSNIKLNINNDSTIIINELGSTDIIINGNSNYFYCFSSGMAPVLCKDFACSTMHANSDGISDFHIKASNKLILELQNNGNIYYYESPNDSIFSITGDGEIIKYY